jgi:hypothetical protein
MKSSLRTGFVLTLFAALFLIFGRASRQSGAFASMGVPIKLNHEKLDGIIDHCFGDDRMTVVFLLQEGDAKINETPMRVEKIPEEMKLIMAYRQSRCVFVVPRDDTPFQNLATLNERMHAAVRDFHVYVFRRGIVMQNAVISVGEPLVFPTVSFEEWLDPLH